MSFYVFWDKGVNYELKKLTNYCYISSKWASIKQSESHNLALFIQKFDQGFYSVFIVDENDEFIAMTTFYTFKKDFPKKNFRRWNNVYIDYSDNEDVLKGETIKWSFATSRREIPILRDRKIVAAGRVGRVSSVLQGQEENFPPIYWELISEETVKDFFGKTKKVLISSKYGNLTGFYERFNNVLDITVYDDYILEQYLLCKFDVLIYGADVWSDEISIEKYPIQQIYCYLLNKQVYHYFKNNDISYFCLVNI